MELFFSPLHIGCLHLKPIHFFFLKLSFHSLISNWTRERLLSKLCGFTMTEPPGRPQQRPEVACSRYHVKWRLWGWFELRSPKMPGGLGVERTAVRALASLLWARIRGLPGSGQVSIGLPTVGHPAGCQWSPSQPLCARTALPPWEGHCGQLPGAPGQVPAPPPAPTPHLTREAGLVPGLQRPPE